MINIDNNEVDKFSRLADSWWNHNGELKTLHQVNPLRLEFIKKFTSLDNKKLSIPVVAVEYLVNHLRQIIMMFMV